MVQGGMVSPQAEISIRRGTSMFEPIGGSAPKYTTKVLLTVGRHLCGPDDAGFLGEAAAAKAIESAVIKVTRER